MLVFVDFRWNGVSDRSSSLALSTSLRDRLRASSPGFGGAPLGNLFRALSVDAARLMVRHAYDAGARYFDTAPHYGHGLSERRIGDALRAMPRDDYVLSTKVGRILEPSLNAPRDQHGYVDTLPFVQRYDYSGAGFRRSLEDSLQRLGLARVDVLYVHDIDRDTHGDAYARRFADTLGSGIPELARLKSDGVIAGYGLGVNDVAICREVLRDADLDVILLAGRYTLADQSALAELLPICEKRGVTIVLGGPFNSGILATGARPADGSLPYFNYAPATPAIIERVAEIESICAAFDVPLKAAALQFPLAHPAVACVVAGVRSAAEFDENLALSSFSIAPDFWRELRARGLVPEAAPLPGGVA